MTARIHLVRPDRGRVVCVVCGRPIRRGSSDDASSWVHAVRRGRPPVKPTDARLAGRAVDDWLAADREITAEIERRDDAVARMLKSGMTTYQIGKAVGVAEGSVRYAARRLGIVPRRVVTPLTTATAMKRQGRKPGSVLFR